MEFSFQRCPHCFAPLVGSGVCPVCGEQEAAPGRLLPGTILKGRYMAGDALAQSPEDIRYRGWDLVKSTQVEIAEYYPQSLVSRDNGQCVVCAREREAEFEAGKQAFFERARSFYECLSAAGRETMDFFVRNGTCYYVRRLKTTDMPQDAFQK